MTSSIQIYYDNIYITEVEAISLLYYSFNQKSCLYDSIILIYILLLINKLTLFLLFYYTIEYYIVRYYIRIILWLNINYLHKVMNV